MTGFFTSRLLCFLPPKVNTFDNQHRKELFEQSHLSAYINGAYLCSDSSCINECSTSTAKEKDRNSCLHKQPYGGRQNVSTKMLERPESVPLMLQLNTKRPYPYEKGFPPALDYKATSNRYNQLAGAAAQTSPKEKGEKEKRNKCRRRQLN